MTDESEEAIHRLIRGENASAAVRKVALKASGEYPLITTEEWIAGLRELEDIAVEFQMMHSIIDSYLWHEQATLAGDAADRQQATDGFASIGYEARWRELNAADFGVPQTRRRVFVMAVREDLPTPSRWFPGPTHKEHGRVSVREVLDDIAPVRQADKMTDNQNEKHQKEGRRPFHDLDAPAKTVRTGTPPKLISDGAGVPNHVPQDHQKQTRQRFAQLPPGETGCGQSNRRLHPEEPSPTITADEGAAVPPVHYRGPVFNHEVVEHSESHKDVIRAMEPGYTGDSVTRRRLAADEPSGTVTVSSATPMAHYEKVRRLTVRECARLQSFPDTHVFTGYKTEQLKQVGNAVPPKLMWRIGQHVREFDAIQTEENHV